MRNPLAESGLALAGANAGPQGNLTASFYRAMWVDRLPPGAALRRAQEAVRSDARFTSPVQWAAWVVSGEGWSAAG